MPSLRLSQEITKDNPMIYTKLDEPGGLYTSDYSKYMLRGVHFNGPTVNQASLRGSGFGKSVSYDGSDDYTQFQFTQSNGNFTDTDYASVFAIFKTTSGSLTGDKFVASSWSGSGANNRFLLYISSGKWTITIQTGGSSTNFTIQQSTATLTANTVHTGGFTYDGVNLKLWLDGSIVATSAKTGVMNKQSALTNWPIELCRAASSNSTCSPYSIQDFAYFGYGLSDARMIAYHAAAVSTTAEPAFGTTLLALAPLAYYKLDDTSGTTLVDSSGNGRNGTYDGAVLNQSPIRQGGVKSALGAATGQGIASVAAAGWIPASGQWTIAQWVQPNNTGDAVGLVSRYSGAYGGWVIWQRGGRLAMTNITPSIGQQDRTMTQGFVTGTKYFFVVAASNGYIRAYVNGQLQATWTVNGKFHTSLSTLPMQIGGYAGANYAQANQSDVALWDRCLTDSEIKSLTDTYNIPPATIAPSALSGIKGVWDASLLSGSDGSSVSAWNDTSGNAKTANANGTAPVLRVAGRYGKNVIECNGGYFKANSVINTDAAFTVGGVIKASAPVDYCFPFSTAGTNGDGSCATIRADGDRSLFSPGHYITYLGGNDANDWERWILTGDGTNMTLIIDGNVMQTGGAAASSAGDIYMNFTPGYVARQIAFGEVFALDRAIDLTTELPGVDQYLYEKWWFTQVPVVPPFDGWGIPI